MKSLEYTKRAFRQLRKLPVSDAKAIRMTAWTLRDWPDCQNVKALTDRDEYRFRTGDFRLIFKVGGDTITIQEVVRRNERTY